MNQSILTFSHPPKNFIILFYLSLLHLHRIGEAVRHRSLQNLCMHFRINLFYLSLLHPHRLVEAVGHRSLQNICRHFRINQLGRTCFISVCCICTGWGKPLGTGCLKTSSQLGTLLALVTSIVSLRERNSLCTCNDIKSKYPYCVIALQ